MTICAERVGLGAQAFDVRALRARRQRVEIEQPRVAVNGRQAVPELVRQARGQLAESSQRVLQAQLLFEVRDLRSDP